MPALLIGADSMEREFKNADELVAAIVKQVGSAVPGSNRRVDPYARNAACHLLQVTDAIPWDSFLYVLFMRADSTNLALLNAVFPEFLADTPEAWKQI
jgi:hypothetical protein